jgi:hypothetical protein
VNRFWGDAACREANAHPKTSKPKTSKPKTSKPKTGNRSAGRYEEEEKYLPN